MKTTPFILLALLFSASLLEFTACKTTKKTASSTTTSANTSNTTNHNNMASPSTISWRNVHSGAVSPIENAQNSLIKSKEEWVKTWEQLNSNFEPIPPVPYVDFTKEWVLVCCMGQKGSGGYAIQVKSIEATATEMKVAVEHQSPGRGCMSITMVTSPYTIVAIENPKTDKLSYEVKALVKNCE